MRMGHLPGFRRMQRAGSFCVSLPMPRYFFTIAGSENGEGLEFSDDPAAREEAMAAFGEMISQGDGLTELRMDVTDETGRRIATLTFTLA